MVSDFFSGEAGYGRSDPNHRTLARSHRVEEVARDFIPVLSGASLGRA